MKYLMTFLLTIICCTFVYAQHNVIISGKGDVLPEGDTILVVVFKFNMSGFDTRLFDKYKIAIKNHQFRIELKDIDGPTEISIYESTYKFQTLDHYVVLPDQEINLDVKNDQVLISGYGSEMFALKYELNDILLKSKMPKIRVAYFDQYISKLDSISEEQSKILASKKGLITALEYQILKDQIDGEPLISAMYIFDALGGAQTDDSVLTSIYTKRLKERLGNLNVRGFMSSGSIDIIRLRYQVDSCNLKQTRFSPGDYIAYIDNNFQGELKERLIVHFLMIHRDLSGNLAPQLKSIVKKMNNETLHNIAFEFVVNASDGVQAYNFTLPDSKGKLVKLSNFRGKVVVLDFWFTGCPGCRDLAPKLKKVEAAFSNKNVQFVSISIDKKISTWLKSISEGIYTTSEVLNINAGQSLKGEEAISNLKVLAYPTLFIIDKNGKLVNVKIDPREDEGNGLIQQIESTL